MQGFVGLEIGDCHLHRVIDRTRHQIATDHLRNAPDSLFECAQRAFLLRIECDLDANLRTGIEYGWRHAGRVTGEHPRFFEPLQTPRAGAGRQTHLVANVAEGPARITLERANDQPIVMVKR